MSNPNPHPNPFASFAQVVPGGSGTSKKSKIELKSNSIHAEIQKIFKITLNMEDPKENLVILPELIEIYPKMIFDKNNIKHAVQYRNTAT